MESAQSIKFQARKFLGLTALIVGLLLTFGAWKITKDLVQDTQNTQINEKINKAEHEINFKIEGYIDVLAGIIGLYQASDEVERGEFTSYVNAIYSQDKYLEIYGFSFISNVPASSSASFLHNLQEQLIQAGITEKMNTSLASTNNHYILNYKVIGKNKSGFPYGYDLKKDKARASVLDKAAQSGKPVISGLLTISGPEKPGFIIVFPVYKNGAPVATPDERSNALVGFINAAFIYEHVFNNIFNDEKLDDIVVHVIDGDDYIFDSRTEEEHLHYGIESQQRKISNGQRIWKLEFYPETSNSGIENAFPIIVLVVGGLISLLFFGFINASLSSQAKARKLAEEMTKKARESEEKFKLYMDNAPIVSWLKDSTTWRYVYINKLFGKSFNVSQEDAETKTDLDLFPKNIADKLREHDLKVLSGVDASEGYEDVPLPNGSMRKWLVFKFQITTGEDNRKMIGGTALDVTELKKAQEELEKSKLTLEKSLKEAESFNSLMVGRELQMIELKKEIVKLKDELGKNV